MKNSHALPWKTSSRLISFAFARLSPFVPKIGADTAVSSKSDNELLRAIKCSCSRPISKSGRVDMTTKTDKLLEDYGNRFKRIAMGLMVDVDRGMMWNAS